jgi:hypothetical protein
VLLMVIGITLFGVLTAGVAAYFVHDPNRGTQDEQAAKILARFDALEHRLDSLESQLDERNPKTQPGRSTVGPSRRLETRRANYPPALQRKPPASGLLCFSAYAAGCEKGEG